MSKVAIASVEGGVEAQVSPVFGRCQSFTVVQDDNGEVEEVKVLDNPHASASQGAGTQTAGMIAREGVEAVVAGNFGPKVFTVFEQTGLEAYTAGEISVKQAAEKYFQDELQVAGGDSASAGQNIPGQGQVPQGGGQAPGGQAGGQAGGSGGGAGQGGGRGRGGAGRGRGGPA